MKRYISTWVIIKFTALRKYEFNRRQMRFRVKFAERRDEEKEVFACRGVLQRVPATAALHKLTALREETPCLDKGFGLSPTPRQLPESIPLRLRSSDLWKPTPSTRLYQRLVHFTSWRFLIKQKLKPSTFKSGRKKKHNTLNHAVERFLWLSETFYWMTKSFTVCFASLFSTSIFECFDGHWGSCMNMHVLLFFGGGGGRGSQLLLFVVPAASISELVIFICGTWLTASLLFTFELSHYYLGTRYYRSPIFCIVLHPI